MLSWLNAALDRLVQTNAMVSLFEADVPGPAKVGIALTRFLVTKSHALHNPSSAQDPELQQCRGYSLSVSGDGWRDL